MPCAPRAASSRAPSSAGTLPASATSAAPAGTGTTPGRTCAATSPSCATRPIPAESPPSRPPLHHHHPFPLLENPPLRGLPYFPGCHPSRFFSLSFLLL
uniref:Putative secreted protein n=1 Tax=Ixodes ricinus TaxID=34613 RepID=A0A6B0UB23_IXORI